MDAVYSLPLWPNGQTPVQGMLIADDPSVDLNGNAVTSARNAPPWNRCKTLPSRPPAVNSARWRMAQREEAWGEHSSVVQAGRKEQPDWFNEILGTVVRLVLLVASNPPRSHLGMRNSRLLLLAPGPSHGISEMGLGLLETLHLIMLNFGTWHLPLSAHNRQTFDDLLVD